MHRPLGIRTARAALGVAVGVAALSATSLISGANTLRDKAPPLAAHERAALDSRPLASSTSLPTATETWKVTIPGQKVTMSSPIFAQLDGTPVVVVGSTGGEVFAISLASGKEMPGWPIHTPGNLPVWAAPSVAENIVYVGVGDPAVVGGGYLALKADGKVLWWKQQDRLPPGASDNNPSRVVAGLSYGYLNGQWAVVAGTMGEFTDARNAGTGNLLSGFPWFSADSVLGTAAIGTVEGGKTNYIVEDGGQVTGLAYKRQYYQGGHLRIISQTGNKGQDEPWKGEVCDFSPGSAGAQPNETIDSSPAIGAFLDGGHQTGIVTGTGYQFLHASDVNTVFALNTQCHIAWQHKLDGWTSSSPALVNARGTGQLEVAEGTCVNCEDGHGSSSVYLLNGSDGAILWRKNLPAGAELYGSITSVQLTGGYQDLLVPTTVGMFILGGKHGGILAELGKNTIGMQSSPVVSDDPNGTLGLTLAGYYGSNGIILHYEFKGTSGKTYDESGAWPMFHHDPHLTGSTLSPIG